MIPTYNVTIDAVLFEGYLNEDIASYIKKKERELKRLFPGRRMSVEGIGGHFQGSFEVRGIEADSRDEAEEIVTMACRQIGGDVYDTTVVEAE